MSIANVLPFQKTLSGEKQKGLKPRMQVNMDFQLQRSLRMIERCYNYLFFVHKFSGTNQKPERRRPFGTDLVRHCPQGLFSPFFTFLCAIFSRPFRLSLAPTICPWVSEDGDNHNQSRRGFNYKILFPDLSRVYNMVRVIECKNVKK